MSAAETPFDDDAEEQLPTLPANLPHIASAKLPELYVAAKHAIARCVQIDECKSWADKMAALASYARQSRDRELMNHAMRVRARAIQRTGEVLKEIEPSKPGPRDNYVRPVAPNSGRTEAARKAGLSDHERITALRVASVPKDEFETAVESDEPPTIKELSERGTRHEDTLRGRDPCDFKAATRVLGLIRQLDEDIRKIGELTPAIRGMDARERARCLSIAKFSVNWLNELIGKLS